MTKQEISEIKKLFTPKNCSITRICGCYVDGEKNKKTELKQAFLALPEEEMFKYFEILRKSLSGTIGKNLLNLEFPLKSETEGGTQEFLLRLRDSRLKDDALLEQFYDRIIESYEYVGNYLILLIHDAYDVPGRTRDGIEMEDASDEVYDYILTCICPVDLSKPGLSYNAVENTFQNRIRDWVVGMPDAAFLCRKRLPDLYPGAFRVYSYPFAVYLVRKRCIMTATCARVALPAGSRFVPMPVM